MKTTEKTKKKRKKKKKEKKKAETMEQEKMEKKKEISGTEKPQEREVREEEGWKKFIRFDNIVCRKQKFNIFKGREKQKY